MNTSWKIEIDIWNYPDCWGHYRRNKEQRDKKYDIRRKFLLMICGKKYIQTADIS